MGERPGWTATVIPLREPLVNYVERQLKFRRGG